MPGFCCSSWEVAGAYFINQHAVKPRNSFPQAMAGADSASVFSCACAGKRRKGLLTLQIRAAKWEVSGRWAAGILGTHEEGLAGLTGCPRPCLGGAWAGWSRCPC